MTPMISAIFSRLFFTAEKRDISSGSVGRIDTLLLPSFFSLADIDRTKEKRTALLSLTMTMASLGRLFFTLFDDAD